MSYEELLGGRRLQRVLPGPTDVAEQMGLARRDLRAAHRNAEEDPDWGYAIAYNAVLQATRALLLARGYRTCGDRQHVTALECLNIEGFDTADIQRADRMRRIRHHVIYEEAGAVTDVDVEEAIRTAERMVADISARLGQLLGDDGETEDAEGQVT